MVLPFLLAATLAQAAALAPRAERLEPEAVPPYSPVEVLVHGGGFIPACRVLLGVPGKLLPVPSEVLGDDLIRVRLSLGVPPQPSRRQLVVECGTSRASPLELRVERRPPQPTAPPAAPSEVREAETAPEAVQGAPPVLERLDPPGLGAGKPGTLTILGQGFAEGAVVSLLANRNAGTSLPPRYEMCEFSTERLSETVLVVELDRGFAPAPRLRSVVVTNPDGQTSAPLVLAVDRRVP